MRPDAGTRARFQRCYEAAAARTKTLNQNLERWLALVRTRLRMQLRLAWLKAIAHQQDLAQVEKALRVALDAFDKATQFAAIDGGGAELKVPPSLYELRREVDSLRKKIDKAAADLPAFGEAACSDPQAALLHLMLLHDPVRYTRDHLPKIIYASDSGVGGKSSVLFLSAEMPTGMVMAAKFDDFHRSEMEWEQIDRLRQLDLPPEFVLPVPWSQRGDGLILSETAMNPDGSRCVTLGEYLADCLPDNTPACCTCLEQAAGVLAALHRHEPGRRSDPNPSEFSHWHAFEMVQDVEATESWALIQGRADEANLGFDLRNLAQRVPDPRPGSPSLPNPLRRADPAYENRKMSEAPVSPLLLGRIHNDLNLTNVLVREDAERTPTGISLIDLARSRSHQPVAFDFARLEVEICLALFTGEDALVRLLECLDLVSGRHAVDALLSPEAALIGHVRHLAWKACRPPGQEGYVLEDYFRCLYFTHLWSIFVTAKNEKIPRPLLAAMDGLRFLAAAASLRFLEDVRKGRYARRSSYFSRPWEGERLPVQRP